MNDSRVPPPDPAGAARAEEQQTFTLTICGKSLGNGRWCNRQLGHEGDCWEWVAPKERVPDMLVALREETDRLRARLAESERMAAVIVAAAGGRVNITPAMLKEDWTLTRTEDAEFPVIYLTSRRAALTRERTPS